MLKTEVIIALTKWIQNWKKIYGESPTINECITWLEWKFEDSSISEDQKKLVEAVLNSNKG
tara:strand:+ start:5602 stop:5784 length:183 start_codon:yes stop_codon:yes gene_type:complete